jgi:hypothetical protein
MVVADETLAEGKQHREQISCTALLLSSSPPPAAAPPPFEGFGPSTPLATSDRTVATIPNASTWLPGNRYSMHVWIRPTIWPIEFQSSTCSAWRTAP